MRAKSTIEELRKEREALIFTEIPYQVNKATLVEKIAELVREKRIEGIADLRDESDRDGMRIVVELKRDAMADVVLNQLYRYTPLQTSFGGQHGGAERRPARAAQPEGPHPRLRGFPRGGRQSPHQASAWARRASARTSCAASPSPSPTSTR